QLQPVDDGSVRRAKKPPIGKAVRRDVNNPHYEWAAAQLNRPLRQTPLVNVLYHWCISLRSSQRAEEAGRSSILFLEPTKESPSWTQSAPQDDRHFVFRQSPTIRQVREQSCRSTESTRAVVAEAERRAGEAEAGVLRDRAAAGTGSLPSASR